METIDWLEREEVASFLIMRQRFIARGARKKTIQFLRESLERRLKYERNDALRREFYRRLVSEGYRVADLKGEYAVELNNRRVYAEVARDGVKVSVVCKSNNPSNCPYVSLRFLITEDTIYHGIGRLNQEVFRKRKNRTMR